MASLAFCWIVLALLPLGLAFAIIDRLRGRPWIMHPLFHYEWHERHMDEEPPAGVFDQWLAEWRETRIKPGAWLEREHLTPS